VKANNLEKFIEKSSLKHDNKYDYSKVVYGEPKTPVEIICPVHGSFLQRRDVHSKGGGCRKCVFESIPPKRTVEEYVKKASKIHSYKYDYSLVTNSKSTDKIDIICHKHGIFKQTVAHHLVSKGCPECSFDRLRLTTEQFKERSSNVHEYKYDYSLVDLSKGFKEKISIICPAHGIFSQVAGEHMLGSGCKKCADKKMGLSYRLTTSEFLSRSKDVHGEKYDYSKSKYISSEHKINIICPIHGEFLQRPVCHMKGKGCIKCRNDKTTYNMVDRYESDLDLGKRLGSIYIVEMSDGKESFLKVGITCNKRGRLKVYNRERGIYNYEFVYEKELSNLDSALLERKIIRELKLLNKKYKPAKNFTGHTECFNIESKDIIVNLIEAYTLTENNKVIMLYE
jgi:hypothetical protein